MSLIDQKTFAFHAQDYRRLSEFIPAATPEMLLVQRTSFGPDSALKAEIDARGYDGFLEWQLSGDAIPESQELLNTLATYDVYGMTPKQIWDAYRQNVGGARFQIIDSALIRAALTRRQLLERMVEFWSDHFNIDVNNDEAWFLKPTDELSVIRKHALGTFPDLLRASAKSPAMLTYLDNATNIVGKPQENYARELMELHTMGVDNGYTQRDVEEVARCLTGWTINVNPQASDFGTYRYINFFHDQGEKRVLGVTIPANGGESDGEKVLDILVAHPSTAWYISYKMCQHFVAYEPADELVDKVVATYNRTGGDIKAMLRVILDRDKLTRYAEAKLKRPFHYLASMYRSIKPEIRNVIGMRNASFICNHTPHGWATPDGYPDRYDFWASALQPRWFIAGVYIFNYLTGLSVDINDHMPPEGQEGKYVADLLSHGRFPDKLKDQLQDFYEASMFTHTVRDLAMQETIMMGLSSPEYNLY